MSILVKIIADNASWFYLLLALIGIPLIRVMILAQRERTRSIFGLERENATSRFIRAMINFLLVLLLTVGVFYVSNTLIEQVPLPEITPTPTEILQLPPTPTPPPPTPHPYHHRYPHSQSHGNTATAAANYRNIHPGTCRQSAGNAPQLPQPQRPHYPAGQWRNSFRGYPDCRVRQCS